MLLLKTFEIFVFIYLSSIIIVGWSGLLTNFFSIKFEVLHEKVIFGSFTIGAISLFLNFFSSINNNLTNAIALIGIIYFFKEKTNIKNLKILLLISSLALITFIFEKANTPDAGLYHLPYISNLNDNKIIIGLNSLHGRFGFVSFFQYISAAFNNTLFDQNGIFIPLVIIYSSTVVFFFKESIAKKNLKIIKVFSFLFLLVILFNMNRFSEFGNDKITHMIFFYFIYSVISFIIIKKNYKENFSKILILSLYLFIAKAVYAVVIIIIFYLIIKYKSKIRIFNYLNFSAFCILLLWMTKNILIGGCALYPKSYTCIEKLSWFNSKNINQDEIVTEAWSKGYPDYKENKSMEHYIKNFNWMNTWISNHFVFILKKNIPIFLLFLCLIIFFKRDKIKKENDEVIVINNLLYFSLFTLIFWLFNFPDWRFGAGFIYAFIITITANFLISIKNKELFFKITKNLSLIFIVIVCLKNIKRIYINYEFIYEDYPYVKINSNLKTNSFLKYKKIYFENSNKDFYYFSTNENSCYYSPSPCTHNKDLKLNINEKYNYKIITELK